MLRLSQRVIDVMFTDGSEVVNKSIYIKTE